MTARPLLYCRESALHFAPRSPKFMAQLSVAALLLTAAASADYTLELVANATGGLSGSSNNYALTAATTPGSHGTSASYTARTGFAGQLGAPVSLAISALALTVQETSTRQLAAELLYDDGSRAPVSDVVWSILSGPVAQISSSGLATPAAVYQDTPAVVRGGNGPFSGDLTLTVLNSAPDNYGSYAADGLPDSWQIQYFGFNAPKAGKYDDFDGDEVGNLIEFASGSHPASSASGPQALRFAGNTLVSPGKPITDYSPAPNVLDHRVLFVRRKDPAARLSYGPQFSRNLTTWSNATTPLTVIADDGTFEVVSVRFPVLIGGLRSSSKFFRLNVSITPP